jgi:methionyl-tRNA synthetase
VKTILHVSLQICASLSILCEPFLPFTAKKLQKMLNIDNNKWSDGGRHDLLKAGDPLNPAEYLFEKIEDETIAKQVQKLEDTKKQNEVANAEAVPAKADVTFDDFQNMDLRVVTVLAAEKVAKTKKLLKLKVNTGVDTREIISGIAEYYQPEDLVGKQVLMLINLAPKNIKGVDSHGMVLMAEDADGSLSIMQPLKKVKEGSTVK